MSLEQIFERRVLMQYECPAANCSTPIWWEGLAAPFPKTPPPAVGPSGLELQPCGPQATFIH